MDTMEQIEVEPIQSDMTEALPLDKQLDTMSKPEKIKYADEVLGYKISAKLKDDVIKKNILLINADRKTQATKLNKDSLAMTVSKEDPEITIRFFNMESSGVDLEFAYSGPQGMYGKEYSKNGKTYGNPKGFKKCPKYHLFPGEIVKLAYSVYEHLSSLTFVTHKTVWDQATGMITGTIPIIKPRFILQPIFTKEQLVKINE